LDNERKTIEKTIQKREKIFKMRTIHDFSNETEELIPEECSVRRRQVVIQPVVVINPNAEEMSQ
jgi:hypothetical protein